MKIMRSGRLPMAAMWCGVLVVPLAYAADEPKDAAGTSKAETLETIVVEGRRDSEEASPKHATIGVLGDLPLIEAPYSVSVIGEHLIDIQQSTRYTDYLKNVPGANVGNVAIGFFSLRGFSVGTDGYLYDGLPAHQGLSETYQLDSFSSIQVFKGPAAFLSGFGGSTSLGGTLNYVPKRATAAPVRTVEFDYTNRALYSVATDLGQRFGERQQFGMRLNARFREGEQQAERYDWTQKAASLALDWQASSTLSFSANLEYADNHLPSLPPFYLLGEGLRVPDAPNASKNVAQSWDEFASTGRTAYLRGDWTFAPGWTLTAQGMTSQTERPQEKGARSGLIADEDGTVFLGAFEERSRLKGNSGQALVRGKVETGILAHNLTFGYTALSNRTYGGFASDGEAPPIVTNLYDPVDSPEPADLPVPMQLNLRSHGTSFLLSDIVDITEQWSVLMAARRARFSSASIFTPDVNDQVTRWSPTGALMFKPVPGSLIYVNYSEGLEQGSIPDDGLENAGRPLPPVITEQVEIGAKLERRGVTYALSVFDLKRPSETTVPTDDPDVPGVGRLVEGGEQRHRGAEITATGRPVDSLELVAGLAYIDPKLKTDDDTDGNRPSSVPRVTANFFADYELGFVPGLFLNAGVYHNAKQYLDQGNTQQLESWTRFDIGARYETRFGGTGARFLVGVENLTDEDYWIGQAGILTIADPLTVKVSARFDL